MRRTPSSRRTTAFLLPFVVGAFAAPGLAGPAAAQSLRGSGASIDIQNRIARQHDYTYLVTGNQVKRFVRSGYLVPVTGNRDFELHAVSYPFARPEAALFIKRLASQYRAACGERLVVTSLTRPQNRQPRNASTRSVHPTGMAVDLRRSSSPRCRGWLEDVLLELEAQGVLEATRETHPPHYHIALFPEPYVSYVAAREGQVELPPTSVVASSASALGAIPYEVKPGDSLWGIAREHGTTVDRLQFENDLEGNRIYAGQVIQVPVSH